MFSTRLSLVTIYLLLRLASPVFSLQAIDDEELIARALDINADAIFPAHQAHKRGLNLVGNVLSAVGGVVSDVGGAVNTLLAPVATTSTPAAATPTTTAANNNNGGSSPATTTAAAGSNNNSNGNSNGGNDPSNANDSSGASSAVNNGGTNNGNSNGNAGNSASPNPNNGSSASGSGNNGGTAPMNAIYTGEATVVGVLTDHSGHTITTTGTAPITLTYVTTLPNGVVSTVTEVITPSAEVIGAANNTHTSAPKVAAVAGSVVAVFIIIFIVAFLLLTLRKRRRAIQLTNSRPESSLSFGTSEMMDHDPRRNSGEPLAPTGSATSFRTAHTFIDGQKMEFPLPPVPSANGTSNQMTSSSHRPVSLVSDGTFDLTERRSRTSLIAERNLYRKIGQYPDAGTYTPFAFAPSSELGHSDEGINASDLDAALNNAHGIKGFHENYRKSRTLDFSPSFENPFSDPTNVTQPAPPAPVATAPLAVPGTSNQGGSSLWRKATFGSSQPPYKHRENRDSHPPSAFANTHFDTLGRKSSTASAAERRTVVSQAGSDYETATETQSNNHSSAGYSYHSAFARYVNDSGENPFTDASTMEAGSPPPSSRLLTTATGWRPATGQSAVTLSVVSSGAMSTRETASTPDPKEFFYHPPSTGQSVRPDTGSNQSLSQPRPWTAQSMDEDGTVRQQTAIAYPSLDGAFRGTSSQTRI